jgi:DNA-directed RNA polymerase specialized sigma24 family protein
MWPQLDALAKVAEFIRLVQTQETGGYKPENGHGRTVVSVGQESHWEHLEGFFDVRSSTAIGGEYERDEELEAAVDDALAQLSRESRELVEYHVHQYMGARRISALLGHPSKTTVHRRVRGALAALRVILENDPRVQRRLK